DAVKGRAIDVGRVEDRGVEPGGDVHLDGDACGIRADVPGLLDVADADCEVVPRGAGAGAVVVAVEDGQDGPGREDHHDDEDGAHQEGDFLAGAGGFDHSSVLLGVLGASRVPGRARA